MKNAVSILLVVLLAVGLAGCGKTRKPLAPEDEAAAISMAANPVSVAEKAAEVFEITASKVVSKDENFYRITATAKAKKAVEWSTIFLIAETVCKQGESTATDSPVSVNIPGPLEAGAEVELNFEVSRFGNPGERTLVIKWVRNRRPGD